MRRSNMWTKVALKEVLQFTLECYINLKKISEANMSQKFLSFVDLSLWNQNAEITEKI